MSARQRKFENPQRVRIDACLEKGRLRAMKTETKSIMLAAAAIAGLLTGCATHEQKKQCTTCDVSSAKGHKASCGTKADCSSKHTCRGKGNCGGKGGCGANCGAKKAR
jgi:hypothetical protein